MIRPYGKANDFLLYFMPPKFVVVWRRCLVVSSPWPPVLNPQSAVAAGGERVLSGVSCERRKCRCTPQGSRQHKHTRTRKPARERVCIRTCACSRLTSHRVARAIRTSIQRHWLHGLGNANSSRVSAAISILLSGHCLTLAFRSHSSLARLWSFRTTGLPLSCLETETVCPLPL